MSRVLITGGCGFIGHHLVKACVNDNDEVTVLDNLSNGSKIKIPKNVKFFKGDIRDLRVLKKITENTDAIFHLAAEVSVPRTTGAWTQSNSINLGGTVCVFDIASRTKSPPVVIYASSAAVYGNSNQNNSETGIVNPINPYGLDKLSCEKQAAMFGQLRGLKTIGLRLFNVYGRGQNKSNQYAGVINKFYKNIRTGKDIEIFGDGKQTRDFIYISDVIRILLAIKRRPDTSTPIMNIATGNSVSILKVAETIKKITGSNVITKFKNGRPEDIRNSSADITLLNNIFPDYKSVGLTAGLKMLINDS